MTTTTILEIHYPCWMIDQLDKIDMLRRANRRASNAAGEAIDLYLSMRSLPCKCSTAAPGVSCERCRLGDLLEQVCEATR